MSHLYVATNNKNNNQYLLDTHVLGPMLSTFKYNILFNPSNSPMRLLLPRYLKSLLPLPLLFKSQKHLVFSIVPCVSEYIELATYFFILLLKEQQIPFLIVLCRTSLLYIRCYRTALLLCSIKQTLHLHQCRLGFKSILKHLLLQSISQLIRAEYSHMYPSSSFLKDQRMTSLVLSVDLHWVFKSLSFKLQREYTSI